MNEILNVKRLLCPMPVIKTQNKVSTMSPGDILTIQCTDPGVLYDIPAWARLYGHEILNTDELEDGLVLITLKVV